MSVPGAIRAAVMVAALAALPAYGQQHAGAAQHAGGGESHDHVTNWKWANFVILAGAIAYAANKFGAAFFASRTREIQVGIEEARRMRESAEARASAMEARLANLDDEIGDLRLHARQEAAAEGERLRVETQRDLEKIQKQAEQEIAAAQKSAQAELRRFAAGLAIQLARQKAAERIRPADEEVLIASFADRVRTLPAVRSSE